MFVEKFPQPPLTKEILVNVGQKFSGSSLEKRILTNYGQRITLASMIENIINANIDRKKKKKKKHHRHVNQRNVVASTKTTSPTLVEKTLPQVRNKSGSQVILTI